MTATLDTWVRDRERARTRKVVFRLLRQSALVLIGPSIPMFGLVYWWVAS